MTTHGVRPVRSIMNHGMSNTPTASTWSADEVGLNRTPTAGLARTTSRT
jgi:hypothetical protein